MMQRNPQGEKQLRIQAAQALLRIAAMFQAAEKTAWPSGPPRSKPGEHLRMDTLNARDNLVYTPTDVDTVAQTLEVAVGYRTNAWYVGYWENHPDLAKRRKGLFDKLEEFRQSGILDAITSSYTS